MREPGAVSGVVESVVRNAVKRPANAYLLAGAAAIVSEAARRLAAALAGIDVPERGHPDVACFGPEGAALYLAAQGEQILDEARRAPMTAERKVVVIEQAESLGGVLESSLLKTLEEPPPSMSFVLGAADATAMPETIVSRCVLVQIPPIPPEEAGALLAARVTGDTADAATAASFVRATGSLAFAADLLADDRWRQRRADWLKIPSRLRSEPAGEIASTVEADLCSLQEILGRQHSDERDELEEFLGQQHDGRKKAIRGRKGELNRLEERQKRAARAAATADRRRLLATLAGFYRDVLAEIEGAPILNTDAETEVASVALGTGRAGARKSLELLDEANQALAMNANASLVIEDVLVQLRSISG